MAKKNKLIMAYDLPPADRLLAAVIRQACVDLKTTQHREAARSWLLDEVTPVLREVGVPEPYWIELLEGFGSTKPQSSAVKKQGGGIDPKGRPCPKGGDHVLPGNISPRYRKGNQCVACVKACSRMVREREAAYVKPRSRKA